MKRNLTKQLSIDVHPGAVTREMIQFTEKNIKKFPGKTILKFNLAEPKSNMKISLMTMENGFEMNDEMVEFLQNSPELDVQVVTA